ncbi:MAG: DNA sulfur modification protein DndB [Coleofasciculaceae cyanobacterium]
MLIPSFEYVLPVIRGIQSGREYYVSMFPVRLLPKLFAREEEIPAEMRAGRSLNRTRVQEIAHYILNNPQDYIFSAITASIDADVYLKFEPIGTEGEGRKIGRLRVPMDARFSIQDGQHRKAALELALKQNPELGYEAVAVIFFWDIGLERSQQMFSDLNRYSVRSDNSLNILYDYRDERAKLVKEVIKQVRVFRGLTDLERSSLPSRSGKLFTLGNIYQATLALLVNHLNTSHHNRKGVSAKAGKDDLFSGQVELAVKYWQTVSSYLPEWEQVLEKKVSAGEVRLNYVHCDRTVLTSLGEIGAILISIYPQDWAEYLKRLAEIDWSRSNVEWQRRISQSRRGVSRVSSYLKMGLGLPLSVQEE